MVGFGAGRIVFDGDPATLDDATLAHIYGGEDWNAPDEDDVAARPAAQAARGVVFGDDAGVAG